MIPPPGIHPVLFFEAAMTFVLLLPAVLSYLVLAAHFLRWGQPLLVLAAVAMAGLLAVPRRWVLRLAQLVLVLASVEWVRYTLQLIGERQQDGRPFLRLAIILGSVAAVNLLAAGLLQTRRLQQRYRTGRAAESPAA